MAVTSILILEPDRIRKDVLVGACLAIFIVSVFHMVCEIFLVYQYTPHYFVSLGTRLWTRLAPLHSKGYLTLVIPGIVSIDHVHCQSKSTTICHGCYAVNTLKVEIETVKGREMSYTHSYHNPHRFLVRWMSPQYWTLCLVE